MIQNLLYLILKFRPFFHMFAVLSFYNDLNKLRFSFKKHTCTLYNITNFNVIFLHDYIVSCVQKTSKTIIFKTVVSKN